ncbi:MAG: hypothetical protein JSW08_01890 [archaeon]|nr:MAG: hypothetical protein JSW08_01890 [archaeon]
MKIDSYSFGVITIDGKTYKEDVIILPNNQIVERPLPKGTHIVTSQEISILVKEKPVIIVVGTGESGIAKIEDDARGLVENSNIKLIVQPTGQAINAFNEIKERKAGLFHLTC